MNPRLASCAMVIVAVCGAVVPAADQGDQVARLLSRAREALGGVAALDDVRSVVLRGSVVQGSGHSQARGEFEISTVVPDKYVRVERRTKVATPSGGGSLRPSFFTDLYVVGLNGPQPIYRAPLLTAKTDVRRATQNEASAIRDRAQQEFAQFAFGFLASSVAGAPLSFAIDPNDPDVIVASGAGRSFEVRFDPVTHLPSHFGDFEYADYRDVGGRRVPHLITKHIGGRLVHVWRIEQVRFNVAIDAKVFRSERGSY